MAAAFSAAMGASVYLNRYAAMDTAAAMLKHIKDGHLAAALADVIDEYPREYATIVGGRIQVSDLHQVLVKAHDRATRPLPTV